MTGRIRVTKVATAYVELESDEVVEVHATMVAKMLPAPVNAGIGLSVLFLLDGTTMNVQESVHQLQLELDRVGRHIFEYSFGKN